MIPNQNESSSPMKFPLVYTPADTVYAWISLLLGFLLCNAVPVGKHPLGGFLLILILFGTGFAFLRMQKQAIPAVSIVTAASALFVSSSLLITDAKLVINLAMVYGLLSYGYFLYAAYGNRMEDGLSNYVYVDFIKILFIFPFRYEVSLFSALLDQKSSKSARTLIKILIGICIAVVPTAVVLAFLSYDEDFMKILRSIFALDAEKIVKTVFRLIYTVLLAMCGFAIFISSKKRFLQKELTVEKCQASLQKKRILPRSSAVSAALPLLFLYAVFFISQWKYYVSAFTGTLPKTFSYAEYAREGFFQLCAVSAINLILIIAINIFIKRGKGTSCIVSKIITTVFCTCTLILISTAIAKLLMYINIYGLTKKRIYAMWLILLIGIVFLLITLGQFFKRFKTVAVCLIVSVALFAALALCNVNALCARYNTEKYLSGELKSIDVEAMEDLGDSAISSLVRLANAVDAEKDSEFKWEIENLLNKKLKKIQEDRGFFSFSIPYMQAIRALKEYSPAETL